MGRGRAGVQSVCNGFSSPLLSSHAFPLLWHGFPMGCSPSGKRGPVRAHHSSFGYIHLLRHGSSRGCSAMPLSISSSLSLSLSLTLLFPPFLPFLFPPPPSTQHLPPFLSYAFTEAPPALLMGSAVAHSASTVELQEPAVPNMGRAAPYLFPQRLPRGPSPPLHYQNLATCSQVRT